MINDTFIYEWNIDGFSEHEIINVLRQMIMAATAYLSDNDDHGAAQLQISRNLRSWWDNCLTDHERKFLQTSLNEEGEQNVVYRICTITKHFVGYPRILQERSYEILQNLRCITLSDFRWYHDVFISKVMTREDARASYWKERFLYGLPRALTEKVQESLRERFQGTIPYDDLTYGDLISEVKKEGLKLCTQLKLQYKVKKDLNASRKDLGSFCSQYGIEVPLPPSYSKKTKHYHSIYTLHIR